MYDDGEDSPPHVVEDKVYHLTPQTFREHVLYSQTGRLKLVGARNEAEHHQPIEEREYDIYGGL